MSLFSNWEMYLLWEFQLSKGSSWSVGAITVGRRTCAANKVQTNCSFGLTIHDSRARIFVEADKGNGQAQMGALRIFVRPH